MTVIGLVLLTGLGLLLVYVTRRVLVWMVIAAFFATALYPAVNWVERRAAWHRRWLATLLVFLAFLAVLAGIIAVFVVPLAHEAVRLADELPRVADDVQRGRGPVGSLVERYHIRRYIAEHRDQLQGYARGLGAPTLAFLRGAATTVAGVVTIIVLAYLMVLEAPKLVDNVLALFPDRRAARIRRVGADCARSVTGYITGNLLISVICGLATYAVLFLTGIPYAGLIAAFVAIADLIPLVGATLGAVVAVGAAFLHSITAGIVVLVFFIVYQQLENHLLQPIILSRTVALNPLTVLVAILIAVELAGILGALLAIPVAGMIQTVARDVWNERQGRCQPRPTVGTDETPVDEAEPPEAESGGDQPPPCPS
ncbi:AI-2E family transporter [Dactylosporangium aurantiacum]|nr:AI-2E family transporter [Dactylosporangium aurantiacum]